MPDADPAFWPMMISLLVLQVALWVLLIVLMAVHWRPTLGYWRRGLLWGLAILLLSLPGSIAFVLAIDPGTLPAPQDGPRMDPATLRLMFYVGAAVGGFLLLLRAGWHALIAGCAVAQWRALGHEPFLRPGLIRRGLVLGIGFGLAAAVLTELFFHWWGVTIGPLLQQMVGDEPQRTTALGLLVVLPAVSGLAVAEELIFRGVLQPWLTRIMGGGGIAVAGSILLVSVVWALLHVPNVSEPMVKVTQIALIGLGLGALAHRFGVASAIAGHVALNVGVTVAEYFWPLA